MPMTDTEPWKSLHITEAENANTIKTLDQLHNSVCFDPYTVLQQIFASTLFC